MTVEISNRQRVLPINPSRLRRLTTYLLAQASRLTRLDPELHVTVILVDDSGIRSLNRDFKHRDEATDVLCFAYSCLPGIPDRDSADLYINVERAAALGERYGGADRELALYVAHGCDHLTGASDRTAAGRRRMRARELRWLRGAAKSGILEGIIAA